MINKELLHLISFELLNEVFGLPLAKVYEIIRMTPILKIPQSPDFVEGIINLRGKVIPVIDLKKRFVLENTPWPHQSRIMIVKIGTVTVGLMVDCVHEVVHIEENAFEEAPQIVSSVHHKFVQGIAKRAGSMIIILDLESLLTIEETDALRSSVDTHKHV